MASTLNLKTPGVYVQEISKFPPSIAAVETAIPAFIGYTEKAKEKEKDDLLMKAKKIGSLLEFERFYGVAPKEPDGAITVTIERDNDKASPSLVTAKISETTRSKHNMYFAMQAFFDNGGGDCYIVSVGNTTVELPTRDDLTGGLEVVKKEDEVTLIVFPQAIYLTQDDYQALMDLSLKQCFELQDRFAIIDVRQDITEFERIRGEISDPDIINFRQVIGDVQDHVKYGAAYYPYIETIYDFEFDESSVDVNVVTGTAAPEGKKLAVLKEQDNSLYTQSKLAISQIPLVLPASPIMAGVYARVDSNRGVWKAPANEGVIGAIQPSVKISDNDQASLNVDVTAGKSINAIRSFIGRGIKVWGARTLDGNSNEWRYVSVRRFFNMVEESSKKATFRFVFEPNDANTWAMVRAMIENFLLLQWRAGALAGAVPEDAFFVKVGLGSTMTALDILEGRMIVEIGMAVVRPAEFIILKFSHKMQES